MAVLGNGGLLQLRREAPPACLVLPADLSLGSNAFDIGCEGYWSGDHVVISAPEGLPIFVDGKPQLWSGVGSYAQNYLFVAENRSHIGGNNDSFYKSTEEYPAGSAGDDASFYYQGVDSSDQQIQQVDGYLCVDSLGRGKLYPSRCEGLSCCGTSLLTFDVAGAKLDFDYFVINQFGSGEYQNALAECFGSIGEYIFNDIADDASPYDPNRSVDSICADAPSYQLPAAGSGEFANADVLPRSNVNQGPEPLWTMLCEVQQWSLELDAPSVDTTGVGEKFGEAVKSLVSGGGSADFLIDRKCYDDGINNGLYLMQLLTMTQMDGCKAKARFYIISDSPSNDCSAACGGTLPGNLWYETEILITRNAISLRPTELVAGSASFVTTGEIKLSGGEVLAL